MTEKNVEHTPPGQRPGKTVGEPPREGQVHEKVEAKPPTVGREGPVITEEGGYLVMSRIVPEVESGKGIHGRPSTIIGRTVDEFKGMNGGNNLEFLDVHGTWKEATSYEVMMGAPQTGSEIRFRAQGPDAGRMLGVVWEEVETRFTRSVSEYVEGAAVETTHTEVQRQGFGELMVSDDLIRGKCRSHFTGIATNTGLGVYGRIHFMPSVREIPVNLGFVERDDVEVERGRIDTILRIERDRIERSKKGIPATQKDLIVLLDAEMDTMAGMLRDAARIVGHPLNRDEVERLGIPVKIPQLICYPNAELSLELAVRRRRRTRSVKKVDQVERCKEELLRTLSVGATLDDNVRFILGHIRTEAGFARAGFYTFNPETEVLSSAYEWKGPSLSRVKTPYDIPLSKKGDGTAAVAKHAMTVGRRRVMHINDVSKNPLTRDGYVEAEDCVWTSMHGPTGELVGVIWADNRNPDGSERPISNDQVASLSRIATYGGLIVSRTVQVARAGEPRNIIVFSRDALSPRDILHLDRTGVLGAITLQDDKTSHSMILAAGRYFPVVVCDISGVTPRNNVMILDPATTTNVVTPNGHILYEPTGEILSMFGLSSEKPKMLINKPPAKEAINSKTRDGVNITIAGALQSLEQTPVTLLTLYSAKGIGLVRSELDLLGEEGWFKAGDAESRRRLENHIARRVINATRLYRNESNPTDRDEEVVIRLPDISHEKYPIIFEEAFGPEGYTDAGMRFLIVHKDDVLVPILRGLCRARKETEHPIGVMMPSITSPQEVRAVTGSLNGIYEEFGISGNERLRTHVLIENPAAVESAREIMEGQDSCGLGTNDLTKHTFGLKTRRGVNLLQFSPTVIRQVLRVCDEAEALGIPIESCGGMGESSYGTVILLGCGVTKFNIKPSLAHSMGNLVTNLDVGECRQIVRDVVERPPSQTLAPEEVLRLIEERIPHIQFGGRIQKTG